MEGAMNAAALSLRLHLLAMRAGVPALVAAALLLLGMAGTAWQLAQRQSQAARPLEAAPAQLVQAPPPPNANENLATFYATVGDKRYAEQQIKVLFDLASKTGLTLAQGDYKFSYDKASGITSYQINLPVKGAYANIWQFSLQALGAMPFAALDDVSFRRETITDATVEARVRFTLYLKDGGGAR
jgi:hypothetical protein